MGSNFIGRAAVAGALFNLMLSGCAGGMSRPQGMTQDAVPRDGRGQPVMIDAKGSPER